MNILIVDDDPTALLIISEMAESLNFNPICADSAAQCLEVLKDSEVSLILCDWEMPGMDGPTLFRTLRKHDYGRYLYLILVTGRDAKEDLIEGLNAGADDFINKPINSEELRVRLRSAERVIKLQQSLDSRNRKLEEVNNRIETALNTVNADLKLAADMQFALLPKEKSLPGIDANWLFKPASVLAGDIFDYFKIEDNKFVFYIVDVEGHGIPSALTSFAVNNQLNPSSQGMCARYLRNAESIELAVLRILGELNRQFTGTSSSNRYFTMIFGVLDLETGVVTISQAGHPALMHYSVKQNKVSEVGNGGMPVGMFEQAEFEVVSLKLEPGDRIYMYSDGAVECSSADGEMYGSSRLLGAVNDWSGVPIEKINCVLDREILDWNSSSQFEDDVSMVCIEYSGMNQTTTVQNVSSSFGINNDELSAGISAEPQTPDGPYRRH